MDCVSQKQPTLAIRSSAGIALWSSNGPKDAFQHRPELPKEDTKIARSIVYSPEGKYLAYTNGQDVKIMTTSNWQLKCSLPRPKAFYLKFSPRGTYLVTWELYTVTKDRPEGSNNMYVYKSETGEEVFSVVQKKQTDWEPSWSADESLFALMVGGEALFYELTLSSAKPEEGFLKKAKTVGCGRNGVLSLAPGQSPPYLAFYNPGDTKGAPSMCKIYKYPNLGPNETVAFKSFFQCDRVEMKWNKRGTGVLILTSTEVDKTGASYYGNQALHFMSTKGESCAVTLKKEGPIHDVQWSPKGNEFVVVYGYMPSSATLFNLKCDPIFNFTDGPMNCAYFNRFGNILLLGGFGNLRGIVSVWDLTRKFKLATLEAPDSTYVEWSPTGEEFITATTAPRLRISNGFKVWHYSGALLHETMWETGQELLGVEWQKYPDGVFKENPISRAKVEGIKSSQPTASKQAYQPPNVRMMMKGDGASGGAFVPQSTIPGLPPGYTSSAAKKNQKNNSDKPKKPRNNNNKTKNGGGPQNNQSPHSAGGDSITNGDGNNAQQTNANPTPRNHNNNNNNRPKSKGNQGNRETGGETANANPSNQTNNEHPRTPQMNRRGGNGTPHEDGNGSARRRTTTSGDPEKDKKIKAIYRKLSDITKLKVKRDGGENLNPSQLTKIAGEVQLRDELKALKISA